MEITSPAFEHHQPIPKKHTCEGEDLSPPLLFRDIPKGTKSLVLIVDDPDAPSGTFDHWLTWNIPPDHLRLDQGEHGPSEGLNHFGGVGYRGPCPPKGPTHRYFFKLYALDRQLSLPEGSSKEQLEEALEGHILGKAELVGTYKR